MQEILTFVTNTGFSIVVAVYLLVRMEKRICELKDSICQLTIAITKVTE